MNRHEAEKNLEERVQFTINSLGDVVRLRRFNSFVDPVNVCEILRDHLQDALKKVREADDTPPTTFTVSEETLRELQDIQTEWRLDSLDEALRHAVQMCPERYSDD